MTCNVTPEDYAKALRQLLPPGPAMQYDDAVNLEQVLLALADTYNAVHDRSCVLLQEMVPATTLEMLPDWERVAGLPDECAPDTTTIEARRAALIARIGRQGGQSKAFYIALAASIGFAITITEFDPFSAGLGVAGGALTNDGWTYCWKVTAVTQTVFAFKAGTGSAGEPLRDWGNDYLECVLNKWKPAHTYIIFDYGTINYV
mgnify:CR=1 FL=1